MENLVNITEKLERNIELLSIFEKCVEIYNQQTLYKLNEHLYMEKYIKNNIFGKTVKKLLRRM